MIETTKPDTGFDVRPGDLSDPRIIALIRHHFEASRAVTPEGSAHALDVSSLAKPGIAFFALWEGEDLLGIGALRDFGDGTAEIKSMRTADHARRRGVAARMLAHLMALAEKKGLHRLYLETGSFDYFAPARALYARHGFVECEPYTGYSPDPNSTFMTRAL